MVDKVKVQKAIRRVKARISKSMFWAYRMKSNPTLREGFLAKAEEEQERLDRLQSYL